MYKERSKVKGVRSKGNINRVIIDELAKVVSPVKTGVQRISKSLKEPR